MNIFDFKAGTAFIRLYRDKFKHEEDFEDLLKFLDLPLDYQIIDIEVDAIKEYIQGHGLIVTDRSYSGR